jgi:hypothetical protein
MLLFAVPHVNCFTCDSFTFGGYTALAPASTSFCSSAVVAPLVAPVPVIALFEGLRCLQYISCTQCSSETGSSSELAHIMRTSALLANTLQGVQHAAELLNVYLHAPKRLLQYFKE